jgi:RNA polymerase sigma factor (sigma-70 family)
MAHARDASADNTTDAELLLRFVSRNDQDAFVALVQRHRHRVLNVCRRLLRDDHDAEDACQATFLVLLRRAASIARPELLANWLYGVALRVAGKARARSMRQRLLERQCAVTHCADPLADLLRRDLGSLLVAEVQRLPKKYRAPLILCYLQGNTNAEAARLLRCPSGSMSYRLARGRELLRQRLIDRMARCIDVHVDSFAHGRFLD